MRSAVGHLLSYQITGRPSIAPGSEHSRGDAQGGQRNALKPLLWGSRPILAAWGNPSPPPSPPRSPPYGGNEKGGSDSLPPEAKPRRFTANAFVGEHARH